ncbi:hypothetical protein Dshi_1708 [Dinoroseobacter shibae DFL 12 = DSM 16493]|jgi:hypothetical protein|uniref:NERD domain-containing protein n=1 Tax=Dinoroseobacter shibae (strain DSM 16493 / NCIMB 14021 / DFL 12) TaxID=398580 RepID=A8LLS2_DINSH|nr:NERD domain-containing protein [Dinoroseobacter shibae]ABV93450.1 hypothetical protein Dshi_1708 [Dinoroseobacter shibae DFL 12 = DSM 16493]URF48363.1 NERD domain-containing protein [Dinoroseobacter shibae]URF52673.1 NERD domain-containing protein [Dinoroseobacter shibae]
MLGFLLKSLFYAGKSAIDTPERKGARGERKVAGALAHGLAASGYKTLSNLILPLGDATTQIDHVVLSRFGIFVIETKNMSGWIFGSAEQARWTQVHKRSRRSFQNPLRQNHAHVLAVQGALGISSDRVHNLVVFTGEAQPKTPMPDTVCWGLRALGKQIRRFQTPVLSEAEVDRHHDTLRRLDRGDEARDAHIAANRARHATLKTGPRGTRPPETGAADTPCACPRCGADMVQRTARKTGTAFWGCRSYPKCRGTRPIR